MSVRGRAGRRTCTIAERLGHAPGLGHLGLAPELAEERLVRVALVDLVGEEPVDLAGEGGQRRRPR